MEWWVAVTVDRRAVKDASGGFVLSKLQEQCCRQLRWQRFMTRQALPVEEQFSLGYVLRCLNKTF